MTSVTFQKLNSWDWLVFFSILAITFFAILWGHKTKKNHDVLEHILMGRQLSLPFFTATLVATWYGGIFAVTEITFNNGLYNFLTQGIFWYVTYWIFAYFIVDRISSYEAVTLPNLVSKMFGPKSAKLSAVFNLFNILPIAYCISLGLFLQILFGGNLTTLMAIGVFIVLLYSYGDGLRAVVYSDLIQFFVMCLSVFLVFIFSWINFGGIQFLSSTLPKSHLSLTGGQDFSKIFIWGLIALSTLVDPNFYQRCFAAKSPQVAKKGIFLSSLVWIAFDLCTTFGALYARAYLPQADPKKAYLIYSIELLPEGARGFFLAGILATILSTLDSYLFLSGITLTYDLFPKKWQNKLLLQKSGPIIVAFFSLILAHLFEGNIKNVWRTLGGYQASCLLTPLLMGYLFPKKLSDNQFILLCLSGVFSTTLWKFYPRSGFLKEVDEIYIGILTTILIIIFILIASSLRSKEDR